MTRRRVVDDESYDAVVGGVGNGEPADVHACTTQDVGDLTDPTGLVLDEHAQLNHVHTAHSPRWQACRPN